MTHPFFRRVSVAAFALSLAATGAWADGGPMTGKMAGNMSGNMPDGLTNDIGQMGQMAPMGHAAAADDEHDESFAFGMPGHANDARRTVHIDMMDNAYSLKDLAVRPGESIRFVIKNSDDFTHEFVLGPQDMMAEHRQDMIEMMERGMDLDTMMHDDPNAVTIPAGQTREFVWSFGQPGEIEFACNIPGHYEAGMHGDIAIVKSKRMPSTGSGY